MKSKSRVSPPSTSLPPLATLRSKSQDEVLALLSGLVETFCPFTASLSSAFTHERTSKSSEANSDSLSVPLADSGYASEVNDDETYPGSSLADHSVVRNDAFERSCAQRWLTGFVTRAEDCPAFASEDARQSAIEDAYMLIESLSVAAQPQDDDDDGNVDNVGYRRDFAFDTTQDEPVRVFLHDKLAGTNSADPDDVGLQSWGASILFSRLLCRDPARFGLHRNLSSSTRVVELGAGTGLVSLAVGALLPKLGLSGISVIATDYHHAVLDNLRENVAGNLADHQSEHITTCALDWSSPVWDAPLDRAADLIIATDVIYSPVHAAWVRDCAAHLLALDGTFWLMAAVRQNGRFEGVSDTVKAAFTGSDERRSKNGRQLCILESERMEKELGIGRGDESWYELFKIGWQ